MHIRNLKIGDLVLLDNRKALIIHKTYHSIKLKLSNSTIEITNFDNNNNIEYLNLKYLKNTLED